LFLYKETLGMDLPWLDGITRAKQRVRVPVVLTPAETTRLLNAMERTTGLTAQLLYGSGMRLMECMRPRVKDGHLEKPSRAGGMQGAPQRIPETYQIDRREVSEEATPQSARAVGFSRCPDVDFERLEMVASKNRHEQAECKEPRSESPRHIK
jgi:hypothetical protein